jgi:hypothetical protein
MLISDAFVICRASTQNLKPVYTFGILVELRYFLRISLTICSPCHEPASLSHFAYNSHRSQLKRQLPSDAAQIREIHGAH